jgi:hypothetical protein
MKMNSSCQAVCLLTAYQSNSKSWIISITYEITNENGHTNRLKFGLRQNPQEVSRGRGENLPVSRNLLQLFHKARRKTFGLVVVAIAATGQARSFAIATTL